MKSEVKTHLSPHLWNPRFHLHRRPWICSVRRLPDHRVVLVFVCRLATRNWMTGRVFMFQSPIWAFPVITRAKVMLGLTAGGTHVFELSTAEAKG